MRAEYAPLVLTSPDAPDKRDGICPTYPTEDIKKHQITDVYLVFRVSKKTV